MRRAKQRAGAGLSVMMLGLRGVPNVQGGIERHVEELAQRLCGLGCTVEVLARASYVPHKAALDWRGFRITPLPAPRSRSLEALVHTLIGVAYAARRRPDILHIHAVGPCLLVPLARLLGLRTVVTHHGFDYERAKWGLLARAILRAGEWAGMRFADGRIAVSRDIAAAMGLRYRVPVLAIPNGVAVQTRPHSAESLARFGLERGRYVVMVSRLVPEKRHLDLIRAFALAALPGWKLALVGGADHEDAYSRFVLEIAAHAPGVVATGFQSGLALSELTAHAGLFVLPSSHEGLPIALLEALGYDLPVLASDISANREIGLPDSCYFPVGDVEALADALRSAFRSGPSPVRPVEARMPLGDYDWDTIAKRTDVFYRTVRGSSRSPVNAGLPPLLDPPRATEG